MPFDSNGKEIEAIFNKNTLGRMHLHHPYITLHLSNHTQRTSNVLEELLASAMFIHTPGKLHALQIFI